jgi:hypothetical protein
MLGRSVCHPHGVTGRARGDGDDMTAAPFDTLKLARALREKAKFTPEQAEGAADAIAEAVQSDLATRTDVVGAEQRLDGRLAGAEQRLDGRMESVRADLRETELRLEGKIAETKADIIKWMFGTIGFQTIVILGGLVASLRLVRP